MNTDAGFKDLDISHRGSSALGSRSSSRRGPAWENRVGAEHRRVCRDGRRAEARRRILLARNVERATRPAHALLRGARGQREGARRLLERTRFSQACAGRGTPFRGEYFHRRFIRYHRHHAQGEMSPPRTGAEEQPRSDSGRLPPANALGASGRIARKRNRGNLALAQGAGQGTQSPRSSRSRSSIARSRPVPIGVRCWPIFASRALSSRTPT